MTKKQPPEIRDRFVVYVALPREHYEFLQLRAIIENKSYTHIVSQAVQEYNDRHRLRPDDVERIREVLRKGPQRIENPPES
jgi:hypothetical protein